MAGRISQELSLEKALLEENDAERPVPRTSEVARGTTGSTLPERVSRDTQTRLYRDRDGVREAYHFTELGECVPAGRPVDEDLVGMASYAWRLVDIGAGVLVIGLGGGWWITSHSICPIEQIARSARRIFEGQLSARIPVGPSGSELGQLDAVLNHSFARAEENFARQQRFTGDASHDLRKPLSVLIAETQSALSRERNFAEKREVFVGNMETARSMNSLAESLLELARLDSDGPLATDATC